MQIRSESIYRVTGRVFPGGALSFLLLSHRPSPAWKLLFLSGERERERESVTAFILIFPSGQILHLPPHLNSVSAMLSHAVDYLLSKIGADIHILFTDTLLFLTAIICDR